MMTELVLLAQVGPWQEISTYEATAHKLFASSPNMHGDVYAKYKLLLLCQRSI